MDNLVYNCTFPLFIRFFIVYNFEDKMWATFRELLFFVYFYIQEYSDYFVYILYTKLLLFPQKYIM